MGLKAKTYMDKGELVPDDVVIGVVEERLTKPDLDKGYMLDGFPRTLAQAEALDKILVSQGKSIDHAILVDVPDEELVTRLSGRRTCQNSDCGKMYHVMFNPPKKEGICDACGSELYQRDDDTEATIRERLTVYNSQTAPLIDYYDKKGIAPPCGGSRSHRRDLCVHRKGLEIGTHPEGMRRAHESTGHQLRRFVISARSLNEKERFG